MTQFSELELRMYTLIKAGKASMMEMCEYYTMDEMLKLYALYVRDIDIEEARYNEMRKEGRT